MKDNKELYNKIMEHVSKEVKKALNEERYGYEDNGYAEDEIDIQSDTERWCDLIDEYLWDRSSSSADTAETLGLFSTLVYLDLLDDEEINEIAECIMNQIDDDDEYDNPPVDEVFILSVAQKLKDNASDWCADVIRDWKLNQ